MFDAHLNLFQKFKKWLNLNRVSRMNEHYLAIKGHIYPKTPKGKKELEYFSAKFEQYRKKTHGLIRVRLLLYLFLYASVTVSVLKSVSWLSFLVEFIQLGNALVGTTVLLVLVLWISVKINLHVELMNESLTHMIALYHKSPQRNTERFLRRLSRTL